MAGVRLWSLLGVYKMETYDPNKNATEVRQASPRRMNLRVLTISMVAIVIAFVVIFAVFSVMQPAPG